jgi:hypothetical protein
VSTYVQGSVPETDDDQRKQAVTLTTSFNGTGAARLVAEKFLETVAFGYRETTDFDCHRVKRTSLRAGVAPGEVKRLFRGALLRQ